MSYKNYPSAFGPKVTVFCADNPTPPVVEVNDAMEALLLKLIKRKPEWTFAITNKQTVRVVSTSGGKYHCDKIMVYQDGEHLGHIQRTRLDSGWTYGIDCRALAKGRQRGSETRTTKLDKAVVLVTSNFRPKPDQERNRDTFHLVRNDVLRAASNARDAVHSMGGSRDTILTWAMDNIDDLRERILAETGISEASLDQYVEARNHALAVQSLANNFGRYGLLIHKDGDYTWIDMDGVVVQRHTTDTLPDDVKSKIAKLKLVEPTQMITGVGYRATRDTYVITEAIQ